MAWFNKTKEESAEDLAKKAQQKREELAAVMQQIKFYGEKTDILASNILLLQKNPVVNNTRIHEEAQSLVDHNEKLIDNHRKMRRIIEDAEKINNKLTETQSVNQKI